jgi:hypothetical protein
MHGDGNPEGMPMSRYCLLATLVLTISYGVAESAQPKNPVIVRTALGGEILGYDVDQNGRGGVLSEWFLEQGGQGVFAIETFDQKTGKAKIVKKIQQPIFEGDFVTLGVTGTSIGLVERQYSDPEIYKTTYAFLNPVEGNKINGRWKPGLSKTDNYIWELSENQGSTTSAFLGFNINTFQSFVAGADVTKNGTGPLTRLTDTAFNNANYPVIAMDAATNQAIVAAGGGGLTGATELAVVDVTKQGFNEFAGLGKGEVNGIGVDAVDGIACTSTEGDWNIEFYDIATETGFQETLHGATSDLNSGADVQFDPVNKLFLIDQQVCAGHDSGTCVQVYDAQGNWVETTNVIADGFGHIAFNPNTRMGFLWLNDNSKFDELESFTY